jgi:hypothetical protein
MENGWYWVLVRAFRNYFDGFHEEWVIVEYKGCWLWDYEGMRRKRLNDIQTVVRYVGPINRPEGVE